MIKKLTFQEDITILNIYVAKNTTSNNVKKTDTMTMEPLTPAVRNGQIQSAENQETAELTNTINQLNIINVYRISHSTIAK